MEKTKVNDADRYYEALKRIDCRDKRILAKSFPSNLNDSNLEAKYIFARLLREAGVYSVDRRMERMNIRFLITCMAAKYEIKSGELPIEDILRNSYQHGADSIRHRIELMLNAPAPVGEVLFRRLESIIIIEELEKSIKSCNLVEMENNLFNWNRQDNQYLVGKQKWACKILLGFYNKETDFYEGLSGAFELLPDGDLAALKRNAGKIAGNATESALIAFMKIYVISDSKEQLYKRDVNLDFAVTCLAAKYGIRETETRIQFQKILKEAYQKGKSADKKRIKTFIQTFRPASQDSYMMLNSLITETKLGEKFAICDLNDLRASLDCWEKVRQDGKQNRTPAQIIWMEAISTEDIKENKTEKEN